DNSELQPSVLLREFLDFVDQHYQPETADDNSLSQLLTTEYPMQPFSGRQFLAEPGTADRRSYDAWWCAVARSLQNAGQMPAGLRWPQSVLPAPTDAAETLDLSRLIRFLQHPVKGFFITRLRLMLLEENRHEDEETFSLAGLEQ